MFLAALVGAATAAYLIVRYAYLHVSITGDRPSGLPQKIHSEPTPRIGGLAVIAGLLAAGAAGTVSAGVSAPFLWMMVAALLPAFAGGFAEDLTRRVGPVARLLVTVVSAVIAFIWLDANLYRSDVAWLDAAFRHWPLSLAGTVLAVAGLAHAMNIIDGYHGLSAGTGVLALLGLSIVAQRADDLQVASVGFAAAGAYAGFLLLNYPFGRIFLGDGGAYLLGATLAILSAQLVGRHTDVSPWFPLVLVVYPVWETLFSILRRATFHRTPIGAPDARHLHSLIYRCVMSRWVPGTDAASLMRRNAATTLPLWAAQAAMVGMAVAWYDSTPRLIAQAYGFLAFYCLVYVGVVRLDRS